MTNQAPWSGCRVMVGMAIVGTLTLVMLSPVAHTKELGQDSTSAWSGVFTDAQAERGKETYEQECSACHLNDLLGDGIAPSLVGVPFSFRWSELSLGDLYMAIRQTMPQGAPASLSVGDYIDIVAYILKANNFPTGDDELPTDDDALQEIIIDEQSKELGQDSTSVWSGVFTDAQAERGKETYEQECSACHLNDLLGDGIAPSLVGLPFSFRWSELSLGDMYMAIRTTMPQGAPASLSVGDYVDIVAYILKANNFPTGDDELPTDDDALQEIIIDEES